MEEDMKTSIIAVVMCILIPTTAFAQVLLTFHDKTTACGYYVLQEGKYCKMVSGGTVCWSKSDIKTAIAVTECEEGGFAQGNTGNTVQSNANHLPSNGPSEEYKRDVREAEEKHKRDMEKSREAFGH
jgi:hypothetical protein